MAEPQARRAKRTGSISQAANGRWKGYVTIDKQKEYFYAPTKREAHAKRQHLLDHPEEVRAKRAAKAGKPVKKTTALTVGDIAEQWIDYKVDALRKPHKPRTTEGHRDNLRLHINSKEYGIGNIDAASITRDQIRNFFTDLRGEAELGVSALRGIHSLLNCAFDHAIAEDKLSANPVLKADRPEQEDQNFRELEDTEVKQIVATLRDFNGEPHPQQARWLLALTMALRPGEALAIEESDVDWNRNRLSITKQLQQDRTTGGLVIATLKSRTSRRVLPVPEMVMDALKQRRRDRRRQRRERLAEGKLWTPFTYNGVERNFLLTQDNGQPIRPRLDTTNWKRLLVDAKLSTDHPSKVDEHGDPAKIALPISRYAARHYAATWMLGKGMEIAYVSRFLGHSDIGLTMRTYVSHKLPEMDLFGHKINEGLIKDHSFEVEWNDELEEYIELEEA